MNNLRLRYTTGLETFDSFKDKIERLEFERLIENAEFIPHHWTSTSASRATNIAHHSRVVYDLKNKFSTINCLEVNTGNGGNYYLTGSSNGSVALWSFDNGTESVSAEHTHNLINKRLKTTKVSIKEPAFSLSDTTTISGLRRGTSDISDLNEYPERDPQRNARLIHSFETKYNKFRLYRANSSGDTPYDRYHYHYHYHQHQGQKHRVATSYPTSVETFNDDGSSNTGGIKCLKWYRNDNGMFFTTTYDSRLQIWDTERFEVVQDISAFEKFYAINQIDSIPGQRNYIAVASGDYYLRFIDLRTMNLGVGVFGKAEGERGELKAEMLCCRGNPLRDYIVASGDDAGHVKLWDLRMRNRLLLELRKNVELGVDSKSPFVGLNRGAHSKSCLDLEWDDSGRELVTVGLDGKILRWEPFNDLDRGHNSARCLQVGDTNIGRIRYKKRVQKRLLMFNKYLVVNTDYGELHIFDTTACKFWRKLELPQLETEAKASQFNDMALQRDLSNSLGLRLLVGLNGNGERVVEYRY